MGNEDKAALFDKLLFERDRYTERGEAGELFGNATNLAALKWRRTLQSPWLHVVPELN